MSQKRTSALSLGNSLKILKNLHKDKEYSLLSSGSPRAALNKALHSLLPLWGPLPDLRLSKSLNGSCFLSATQQVCEKPWSQEQPWPKNEIRGRAAGLGISSASLISPEHTSTARQAQPLRPELQSTHRCLGPEREAAPTWALRQTAKTWASKKVSSEKKLSQDTYFGYSLTQSKYAGHSMP